MSGCCARSPEDPVRGIQRLPIGAEIQRHRATMVRRKQTTSRVADTAAHNGLSRRRQKALAAHTIAATPFIGRPVGAGCPAIAMGRSLGQVQCVCEGDCHVTTFRGKAAG